MKNIINFENHKKNLISNNEVNMRDLFEMEEASARYDYYNKLEDTFYDGKTKRVYDINSINNADYLIEKLSKVNEREIEKQLREALNTGDYVSEKHFKFNENYRKFLEKEDEFEANMKAAGYMCSSKKKCDEYEFYRDVTILSRNLRTAIIELSFINSDIFDAERFAYYWTGYWNAIAFICKKEEEKKKIGKCMLKQLWFEFIEIDELDVMKEIMNFDYEEALQSVEDFDDCF